MVLCLAIAIAIALLKTNEEQTAAGTGEQSQGGSAGGIPESPAVETLEKRPEDNFGKPVDALDGSSARRHPG